MFLLVSLSLSRVDISRIIIDPLIYVIVGTIYTIKVFIKIENIYNWRKIKLFILVFCLNQKKGEPTIFPLRLPDVDITFLKATSA